MKPYRSLLLFPLLASLLTATPALAGLKDLDGNIRAFIQAASAKDRDGAFKSLGIASDNAEGVSLVQKGIETLGGKKIDDITRTNYQYNWTNGTETLDTTYHIRTGKEGVYFGLELVAVDKKMTSLDFSFEQAEADPFEVHAINYTQQHWGALLAGFLLGFGLFMFLVISLIRRFLDKKPPKLPGS